jgi:hypothetical protein
MLWVGTGGHRSLLMGMVWVWVQIRRKMLGSAGEAHSYISSGAAIGGSRFLVVCVPRCP